MITTNLRINKAQIKALKERVLPYMINFGILILTSYFLSNESHIKPARAPIGVKYAATLEAMIEAYIALKEAPSNKEAKRTDIGMLLIRLDAKVPAKP